MEITFSPVLFLVVIGINDDGGVPWGWGGGVLGSGWGSGIGVAVSLLWLWWVDSLSLVLDIGDESTVVVSLVGDGLDATIGKVDTVRSCKMCESLLEICCYFETSITTYHVH